MALQDINTRVLAQIPPLDRANPFKHTLQCKVCGSSSVVFDAVDFNKYCAVEDYYEFGFAGVPVVYWRCIRCSFVFTDFCDTWTPAEFARHIYNADYIKVDGEYAEVRPDRLAAEFARRLHRCKALRILDYGSGAGVFVDRMRKAGFTAIEGYDPFSSPRRPQGRFDIITCFEVIEHAADPRAIFADMCGLLVDAGFIVFSQTVQPPNLSAIRGSWWYLAPRNGHISTYSEETLFILACRLGMTMHRSSDLYAFVRGRLRAELRDALHTVGPPLWINRVFAPDATSGRPAREAVVWETVPWPRRAADSNPRHPSGKGDWHQTQQEEIWSFRWTASDRLSWLVHWDIAGELQFRIAYRREAHAGFAALCQVLLNGIAGRVTLDRGDIVAEFNVPRGGYGALELRTPALPAGDTPIGPPIGPPIGLAVLTGFPPPLDSSVEPARDTKSRGNAKPGNDVWTPGRLLRSFRR